VTFLSVRIYDFSIRERHLALVQAGKVPPIPIETRPADQASTAMSDLKSGGKVRGRVVLHHQ